MESERKNGSVSCCPNENRTVDRKKKQKDKKIRTAIIYGVMCIIGMVFICIFLYVYKYASQNNCLSVFMKYVSNSFSQIALAIIANFVCAYIINRREKAKKDDEMAMNEKKNFLSYSILVFGFIVILFCFEIGLATEVRGAVLEKEEKKIEEKENQEWGESDIVVSPYDVDDDPFMETEELQTYLGRMISNEEIKDLKVEILVRNIENNKPNGSQTKNFNDLRKTANAEYIAYLNMYQYEKETNDFIEEVFEYRIEILKASLNNREKADKECELLENERPIATGYKDLADEFNRRKKYEDAFSNYELGASWYMRTICHAAAIDNLNEVKLCMDKFEELGEEVEKLEAVSIERRERILNMIEVYKLFVDELTK